MSLVAFIRRLASGCGRDCATASGEGELRNGGLGFEAVAARGLKRARFAGIEHDHAFRSRYLAQPRLKIARADGIFGDRLAAFEIEVLWQEEPACSRPAASNGPAMAAQEQDKDVLRLNSSGKRAERRVKPLSCGLFIQNGDDVHIILPEKGSSNQFEGIGDGLSVVDGVAE